MGQAGFYSRAAMAWRLITAQRGFQRIIRLEQRTGKCDDNEKNRKVVHYVRRRNRNLGTFRQTHLDCGHVMTACLLDCLILGQSTMNYPCED